jgi:hypothetical protein
MHAAGRLQDTKAGPVTGSVAIRTGPVAATVTAAGDFRAAVEAEAIFVTSKSMAANSSADSTATVAAAAERLK